MLLAKDDVCRTVGVLQEVVHRAPLVAIDRPNLQGHTDDAPRVHSWVLGPGQIGRRNAIGLADGPKRNRLRFEWRGSQECAILPLQPPAGG
eukprot:5758392-Pyramimonas_sp.AAC.1